MTPIALVLILISVCAHAFWNLLGKRHTPSAAFFLIAILAAALCLAPLLLYFRQVLTALPSWFWSLVAATGIFEAIYYTGLAGAYRRGSMSVAYPLARAIPVLLIALISLALGRGHQISDLGLAGMIIVGLGCLILPLPNFRDTRPSNYLNACCLLALVAAVGTSGYTLVDDEALRQLRTQSGIALNHIELTLLYMALQTISAAVFLAAYTLARASERRYLVQVWRASRRPAITTGLIITATYGLVLASMAHVTNVSYVAAFRQLSIPLGAILGIVVQKEPRYLPKMLGTGIVFAGLVVVGIG